MTNLLRDFDSPHSDQDDLQSDIAMKSLQKRLQYSLNREKRFSNQAAHELNTPLTIINAYFEMAENLAKQGNTAKVQEVLKKAKVGIKQLQQVVQQLLVLSRLDNVTSWSQKHTANSSMVVDIIYEAVANLSEFNMTRVTLPDNLPENTCDINLELGSTALKNLLEHVLESSSQAVSLQVKTYQDKVYFMVSDKDLDQNKAVYINLNKEIETVTANSDTLEKKYKNYNKILEDSDFLNHGLELTIAASIAELYQGELLQETELSQNLSSPVGQRWILALNLKDG